jgi:hypothetical protein
VLSLVLPALAACKCAEKPAANLRARPHLYFRSARPDELGRIAVASLDRPNEQRWVEPKLHCDRVYVGGGHGLCLFDNRENGGAPAMAVLFDSEFRPLHTVGLAGYPSRVRISSDGRYAATTVFATGDTYASPFSTRTVLIDFATGNVIANLEDFTALRDGQPFKSKDFNYWGVTFARDSNRFYATLSSGTNKWLVQGDIAQRQVRVLRDNVECPSLSPDERRLAFKSTVGSGPRGPWQIHVLTLADATLADAPIAETRNIDDQVEWLDNEHLLYGIVEDQGLPEDAMNIWVSSIHPDGGAPILYVHSASSPAVVR